MRGGGASGARRCWQRWRKGEGAAKSQGRMRMEKHEG
jgi:hypothetical protein